MYWINENNPDMRGNCKAFYADSVDDISKLPTSTRMGVQQGNDNVSCQKVAKGSSCLVLGGSKYYILNSQDVWTEL